MQMMRPTTTIMATKAAVSRALNPSLVKLHGLDSTLRLEDGQNATVNFCRLLRTNYSFHSLGQPTEEMVALHLHCQMQEAEASITMALGLVPA